MSWPQRAVGAVLCVLLFACAGGQPAPPVSTPVSDTPPVGAVTLRRQALPVEPPVDLAIVVFDEGLDGSVNGNGNGNGNGVRVFPTVRKAESLLLPVALAQTVEEAGAFGVVRVVHSPAVHMGLVVEGQILRADGAALELKLRVRAADGELLFERAYFDEAQADDYPVAVGEEPFADLYRAISNDLVSQLLAMDQDRRRELSQIALMRFGAEMAPDTFGRFVHNDRDGRYILTGFPAANDPMLLRLRRLRRQDELFIDTVDQQYKDLHEQVFESYALWREYSYELQRYGENYRDEASERKRTARRGSYAAMQQVYASFRKVKIQEEDLGKLVAGFTGESLETVLRVDDGVFRLSGSVEDRYREWRDILTRIDALETGGLSPP